MKNFAVIGVGGYIAPRHLKAIRDTGNQLVAAVDPQDSVGLLDHYSFDVRFFNEIERLDRHLEKLKRGPEKDRVQYLVVCSPNYLHDAHCRLGLRTNADVICEKPLVINPWNLDALAAMERETGRRIFTVLQLRVHPMLVELRARLAADDPSNVHEVELTYITSRGPWYDVSWKGAPNKSGGVPMNIGIHLFDLLLWLFGDVKACEVHLSEPRKCGGYLELARARVRWFLSIDPSDLPFTAEPGLKTTHRAMNIDGNAIEFSEGFGELHTRVYEDILAGRGHGIEDARPSIDLVHRIRTAAVADAHEGAHPLVLKAREAG